MRLVHKGLHELAQSSDHYVQKRRVLQEQNLEGVETPNRTIGFKFDGSYPRNAEGFTNSKSTWTKCRHTGLMKPLACSFAHITRKRFLGHVPQANRVS